METEKTTSRPAMNCDDLVGAVAEALGGHSAAGFLFRCARLRFWPRQASIAERAGAAGRTR
jgi:hypothetical protein